MQVRLLTLDCCIISMASTRRILQSLLLLLAMKLLASQSNQFTYNGFSRANLTLSGVAGISNGLLHLTNDSVQKFGRAFHPIPLQFKNLTDGNVFSFTTEFVFAICSDQEFSGHGLAFTISPSKEFPGALPGQYLGLFNSPTNEDSSNQVFAVELDIIYNSEFKDFDNNHVGIDINSLISNQSKPAAYFTNGKITNITLNSGKPIRVWIDYDGVEKNLNVTLSPLKTPKPNQPLLSSKLDLSPILLDNMYLGFSSATGTFSTFHYLLGWSFKMNGGVQPLDLHDLPSLPRRRLRMSIKERFGIWVISVIAVLALIAILGTIYLVRKRKFAELLEDWENEYGPHRISYKDLFQATKGFKELLGRGGFGKVYKGVLPTSKIEVAVKRISHEVEEGLREFVAEIESLGRLRHRNLVQLLGYCRRKGELLLVYEFMAKASLDRFVFNQVELVLSWKQRFTILRGVASGLLYLHEGWGKMVVHRDIKASNVLIDNDYNGKLGDFGLARLYDHGSNPHTTRLMGTAGYVAPEVARTGKSTASSDVYAFGVLLLEVACGRRPIESLASPEEILLVDWVRDCWKRGEILECRDPLLGHDYVVEEMEMVLKLGLLCSHSLTASRPSMRMVKQFLDREISLPDVTPECISSGSFAVVIDQGLSDSVTLYPSWLKKISTVFFSGSSDPET